MPVAVVRRTLVATLLILSSTVLLSAAALLPSARAAVNEADLLPVDKAFALTASADGAGRVKLSWAIAEGYYLYRQRIKVSALSGATVGALTLPNGTPHEDPYFGRVETYRRALTGTVPVTPAAAGAVTLKVSYQGCADAGVCYPPQTRSLSVAMASAAGAAGSAASAQTTPGAVQEAPVGASGDGGLGALTRALGGPGAGPRPGTSGAAAGTDALPLPPEQAFGFDAIARDGNTLLLRFTPARGYYLYRDKTTLSLKADGVGLGAPQWPRGQTHRDEHFGEVVVYFDEVEVPLPLQRRRAEAMPATLTVSFQGCQTDGICYPPMTRTVPVALPVGAVGAAPAAAPSTAAAAGPAEDAGSDAAPRAAAGGNGAEGISAVAPATTSAAPPAATAAATAAAPPAAGSDAAQAQAEDARLAASLGGPNRWVALLGFFGAGLLLAFTPCVLPMVPILSGLIAGQGTRLGTRRALWLSFVYVLANALVFTAAGVIAALLGANLQAAFQTPWVLVLFALLFVALALSSFGLFEIQLPQALRNRLGAATDRQRGGSVAGVAAMGALSALIVGPCVAPPLAAAVLYISQSHDPVFGGLALFVLAMGMGAPLLAFGAAAGRGLPTSGPWMLGVQRVFGFLFLGLAVWMLSRILPGPVTLALFGALALAAAAWAMDGAGSTNAALRWAARFAGLLLAVAGAAQLLGAMSGGSDPLKPLAGLRGGAAATKALSFKTIKSSADLDRALAAAAAAGKPVLFDFYADWCVSCKEMEHETFTDPGVQAALADVVLLKADVTANDAADQALMARFGIIGPPGTLFFVNGEERRAQRLVGFEKAEPFIARIRTATAASGTTVAP